MSTTIKRVPKPDFEKHNAEVEAIKKTIDALIEKRVSRLIVKYK